MTASARSAHPSPWANGPRIAPTFSSHIMDVDAAVAVTLIFGFLLSAAGVLGLAWYLQSGEWGEEPATAWWSPEAAREETGSDG